MKKLIIDFDVQRKGHNIGYITYLVNFIKSRSQSKHFCFLLNIDAKNIFCELIKTDLEIEFFFPNVIEGNKISNEKNDFKRRELEWNVIMQYAKKTEIDELLFLHIDQYLPSVCLRGFNQKPLSGIYFRPQSRIYYCGSSLQEFINFLKKKCKKSLLEYIFFKRAKVKKIFLLNDEYSVLRMAQKFGNKFEYLPDPIFHYEMRPNYSLHKEYNIVKDTPVLLIFGAISERKNLENIISALNLLGTHKKIVLLIIGSVIEKYLSSFNEAIKKIPTDSDFIQLILDNRFVSDEEMESIFSQSDLILIPYKDLFTSSGIIGTAAKYGKKCMVSNVGVLAELSEKYKLGIQVNPNEVTSINEALQKYLFTVPDEIDYELSDLFIQDHQPSLFAKTLLQID